MIKFNIWSFLVILLFAVVFFSGRKTSAEDLVSTEDLLDGEGLLPKVEDNLGVFKEQTTANANVNKESHEFSAHVGRMMTLIINSLYRNKDIFLRELISNASDALDKIRILSLTNSTTLETNPDLHIRIKADKENNVLHIIDSGVGMTREELINNLGTIAKSGTADFLKKIGQSDKMESNQLNDLIGQFGVGFYSAFLVADRVVVVTKSNDADTQYVWESDSKNYSIYEDHSSSLLRGTQITLHLKEEAKDFLEESSLVDLIKKYSQFINFPIYLWKSRQEKVQEPIEEEAKEKPESDDDVVVEEQDDKPKTKEVEKTVWDWEVINIAKPIWTRKPSEISDEEYNEFYKSITKDTTDPLSKIHFTAEGEVTFKALLFVPQVQQSDQFNRYGTKTDTIKMYVRRVFITDDFQDMLPSYLSFIRGLVDSDDLPLNVSRETLQQHKLLKVIKKKLVRKVLDMLRKVSDADYEKFWKEYSTNIKLGIIEDSYNRARLAKLLRYQSSNLAKGVTCSLADYVKRIKEKQEFIYYIAGTSYEEVSSSPFVEKLLKRGYEVLYMTDAVDEYAISSLPEFEGKKFQNVAKDGLKLSDVDKDKEEVLKKEFEPLTKWLESTALKDMISKASVSQRLHDSPCALVASQFGWTGNMERLARSNAHAKSEDVTRDYYLSQKKAFEINPKHPITKELLRRVKDDESDEQAHNIAKLLFETATLRSGYHLQDTASYAQRVETLLRKTLGVDLNEQVEDEEDFEVPAPANDEEEVVADDDAKSANDANGANDGEAVDEHDEL